MAALQAPTLQNLAAAAGGHPRPESMDPSSPSDFRLIDAFRHFSLVGLPVSRKQTKPYFTMALPDSAARHAIWRGRRTRCRRSDHEPARQRCLPRVGRPPGPREPRLSALNHVGARSVARWPAPRAWPGRKSPAGP
jgi:hypothetical protein